MKKLILIVAIMLLFPAGLCADKITLNSSEILCTPTATHLDWYVSKINAKSKTLQVTYRWLDADGTPLFLANRHTWQTWTCRNISDNPGTVGANCTGLGEPWPCCTGVGTGDCNETTTDFSDIFAFQIRSQDVGTSIGIGLRTLIWNKMKGDILTITNDGTFIEE